MPAPYWTPKADRLPEDLPVFVQWLCQCGNGDLKILEENIPAHCPLCGVGTS